MFLVYAALGVLIFALRSLHLRIQTKAPPTATRDTPKDIPSTEAILRSENQMFKRMYCLFIRTNMNTYYCLMLDLY